MNLSEMEQELLKLKRELEQVKGVIASKVDPELLKRIHEAHEDAAKDTKT